MSSQLSALSQSKGDEKLLGMNRKRRKKDQLSKSSKIAIIGAGIGGLSTALSLQRAGFHNIHVFEKRCEPKKQQKRRDGYGMTLTYNPKGPLAKLGILEELAEKDTPSRSHYVFLSDGSVVGYYGNAFSPNRGHGQRGNLRVPRQVVLDIMLAKININNENNSDCDSVMVNWGAKLKRFDIHKSEINQIDYVNLLFEDGTTELNVNLLIGADGVHSIVRSQIISDLQPSIPKTPLPLQYIKVFLILGISHLDHPLLRQRGFYTLDGTHRLFTMPFEENDDTYELQNNEGKKGRKTMWQLSFYFEDEDEAMNLAKSNEHTLLREVKKRVKEWHTPVWDMVNETEEGTVWGTALMDHPTPLTLHTKSMAPCPPLILLGDAIHPMSPFKGQGANQALTDGPALTEWLLKSKLASALLGFEREMHSRTRPKVISSHKAAIDLHSIHIIDHQKLYQEFAGVKKNHIGLLLKTLRKSNINASLGDKLDVSVKKVIDSLDVGMDTDSHASQVDQNSSELAKCQALSYASTGKTFELRNIPIQHSCSIIQNARDKASGRTCLFLAAIGAHLNTTKWLLTEACVLDVDGSSNKEILIQKMIDNSGKNPLHAAVIGGNPQIVRMILSKCRKLGNLHWENMHDNNGNTPAMLVKKETKSDMEKNVLELLLK